MANDNKNPKIMPNNFEAEQSLLGAILIDADVATVVLAELKIGDFYFSAHNAVLEVMLELQRSGKPIDIVTVVEKLLKKGDLNKVGGTAYLNDLTNLLPSSANYKYYFDIVVQDSMLRKIIGAGNKIIENSYKSEDSDLALSYAEKTIFDLSDTVENKDLIHVNETVNSVMHKFEEILVNPDGAKGLLTHFKNLDDITFGYLPGQMIVLAARPGCGKTSFAMNIVSNIALNNPEKVIAVFNLEMSIDELTQRILLSTAHVAHKSVKNGANAEEFKKLWQAKRMLEEANIYIDDTTGTTPEQIMSKCRRLKQLKKRLDFVVIDYLQLLKSHTPRSSIQQEVSEISRSIKIMAKELKVPVFILSQTSRDLEKRNDGEPKLSDLRDSGAIEQDADQVYFLIKDPNQEDSPMEIIDLVILKHRSGERATLHYKWEGSMVRFTAASSDAAKQAKESNKKNSKKADNQTEDSAEVAQKSETAEVSQQNETPELPQKNETTAKQVNKATDIVDLDTKSADNTVAYNGTDNININETLLVDRVDSNELVPPPNEDGSQENWSSELDCIKNNNPKKEENS